MSFFKFDSFYQREFCYFKTTASTTFDLKSKYKCLMYYIIFIKKYYKLNNYSNYENI